MRPLLPHSDSLPMSLTVRELMYRPAYLVRNRSVLRKCILCARDVHTCVQDSIVQLGMELPTSSDGSVRVAATPGSVLTHA